MMHYFDSHRARLPNSHPQYYDEIGPVAAMPKLTVEPERDDGVNWVSISVMLLDRPNCASWYSTTIPQAMLSDFVAAWRENPETVLKNEFKWPGMQREAPTEAFSPDDWADVLGQVL